MLPGYDYDVVDEDVLTKGLSVADHRIRLGNGTEYRELVLPPLRNFAAPSGDRQAGEGGGDRGGHKAYAAYGDADSAAERRGGAAIADRLWAGCGAAARA